MREMLAAAAHFPQTFIRLVPDARKMQKEFALHGPARLMRTEPALPRLVQRVHDFAENIELKLVVGSIADTHRFRIFITGQPFHLPFCQAPLAPQSVHDLDLAWTA